MIRFRAIASAYSMRWLESVAWYFSWHLYCYYFYVIDFKYVFVSIYDRVGVRLVCNILI